MMMMTKKKPGDPFAYLGGEEFFNAICTPMPGIPKAALFASMDREMQLSLQRWVEGMADKTLASDGVNAADKEAVTNFLSAFKSSFGKDGNTAKFAAIETAVSIAVLAAQYDEGITKDVRRRATEHAREKAAAKAKGRWKDIAAAFRKVAENENRPLKAGEKYINAHFRDKLGQFLPEGFVLGKTRVLRDIVAKIKGGQL